MSRASNTERCKSVKTPKTAEKAQPTMVVPGLDIPELVEKVVREQVKQQVATRLDKLILAVIHGSTNLGIWCPHRDDNMVRLTEEARKHIRAEIQRSFQAEVLHQVAEMAGELEKSIKQRVDENMALFEVGQGNWVFRIMGEQIKAHVAKTLAKTVNGLELRADEGHGED